MTTDYRALCAELLAALDAQALRDPEMDGGILRREARIALAQPVPVGPTAEELDEARQVIRLAHIIQDALPLASMDAERIARAVLQRYGRPAIEPVPVSERPWEREGWCDAGGKCWMGDGGGGGFVPSWRLCKPSESCLAWSLPHHALPLPPTT